MVKIKAFLRLFYVPFLNFYRRFRYFIVPNIFSQVKITMLSKPGFQQLTLFTGKGEVQIGKDCVFGAFFGGFNKYGSIEIQAREIEAQIVIENGVRTNNNLFICSAKNVFIGENTFIGEGVVIMDFEAHCIDPNKRNVVGEIGTIYIGKNVWIGNKVTILKNSFVGDNSIIAAGAVVSGVFGSNSIIGGIPAKLIRKI